MGRNWGRAWIRVLGVVLAAKMVVFGAMLLDIRPTPCLEDLATASTSGNVTTPSTSYSGEKQCHPELLRLLRLKMASLEKRENELDKREQDLELLKKDIEDKIKQLKDLQRKLEGPVKKKRFEQGARLQHLASVYSSMDPLRAAALLDKLDEDTVTKLFAIMKSKKVAKILANMSPEKAARISARLYGRNEEQ